MKAHKGHVRYIDMLLAKHCGMKPMGVLRYYFTSLKGYNGYVMKKFSSLPTLEQCRLLKLVERDKKHRRKTWRNPIKKYVKEAAVQ